MAGETNLTIVGNLVQHPELRFTASGDAVANFTVASTPRVFDAPPANGRTANPSSSGAPCGGKPPSTSPKASPREHE